MRRVRLTANNGTSKEMTETQLREYIRQMGQGYGVLDGSETDHDIEYPITLSAKEVDVIPALGIRLVIAFRLRDGYKQNNRDLWRFIEWFGTSGGLVIEELT